MPVNLTLFQFHELEKNAQLTAAQDLIDVGCNQGDVLFYPHGKIAANLSECEEYLVPSE